MCIYKYGHISIYIYIHIDSTCVCQKKKTHLLFQYHHQENVSKRTPLSGQDQQPGSGAPDVFVLSVVQCVIDALDLSGPVNIWQVG